MTAPLISSGQAVGHQVVTNLLLGDQLQAAELVAEAEYDDSLVVYLLGIGTVFQMLPDTQKKGARFHELAEHWDVAEANRLEMAELLRSFCLDDLFTMRKQLVDVNRLAEAFFATPQIAAAAAQAVLVANETSEQFVRRAVPTEAKAIAFISGQTTKVSAGQLTQRIAELKQNQWEEATLLSALQAFAYLLKVAKGLVKEDFVKVIENVAGTTEFADLLLLVLDIGHGKLTTSQLLNVLKGHAEMRELYGDRIAQVSLIQILVRRFGNNRDLVADVEMDFIMDSAREGKTVRSAAGGFMRDGELYVIRRFTPSDQGPTLVSKMRNDLPRILASGDRVLNAIPLNGTARKHLKRIILLYTSQDIYTRYWSLITAAEQKFGRGISGKAKPTVLVRTYDAPSQF